MKKLQFIIALLPLALGITITLSNCERPEDNRVRVLNQADLNNDYTDLVSKASNNGDTLITSNARIALGRVLFYDVKLSRTNAIACGSCHKQQFAFADNVKKSTGFAGNNAKRNSPAIQNLSQQHRLFWDGRADSLRQLVFMPIQDHIEMGFENIDLLPSKLGATDYYPTLFTQAFGSPVITKDKIGRAMSEFIQILRSDNSKFD
ncbi:MAG: cytochrome-c peroxidase [Sphingobacteriales bacterium JAD_PAG50586_3]|nr:MAG: cytochrome-c peroxidase [Sphingobacteriales bacterium JAD_PAG50586_3]